MSCGYHGNEANGRSDELTNNHALLSSQKSQSAYIQTFGAPERPRHHNSEKRIQRELLITNFLKLLQLNSVRSNVMNYLAVISIIASYHSLKLYGHHLA